MLQSSKGCEVATEEREAAQGAVRMVVAGNYTDPTDRDTSMEASLQVSASQSSADCCRQPVTYSCLYELRLKLLSTQFQAHLSPSARVSGGVCANLHLSYVHVPTFSDAPNKCTATPLKVPGDSPTCSFGSMGSSLWIGMVLKSGPSRAIPPSVRMPHSRAMWRAVCMLSPGNTAHSPQPQQQRWQPEEQQHNRWRNNSTGSVCQ